MKRIEHLLMMLVVSFCCCSTLMGQTKKDFTVQVTNVPTKVGRILVATDDGKYYGMATATDSLVEVKLGSLPNGKYKINVFHDANDNWKLDMEDGIPLEYCASQIIEVTDSIRNVQIPLVDVRKKVKQQK